MKLVNLLAILKSKKFKFKNSTTFSSFRAALEHKNISTALTKNKINDQISWKIYIFNEFPIKK